MIRPQVFHPIRNPIADVYAYRGSFSPGSLFGAGEQGAWYDPSDWSTLYQDSAGTTPVTAVEQPVGLMLDKSKGLVLGPELLVNGDFSAGSQNWTVQNADATHVVTFSGGTVRYQSGTTTPVLSLTYGLSPLVPGRTYLATVTVSASVSGTVKIDSANNSPFVFGGSVGVFAGVFTPVGTSTSIVRNSANVDVTIDNISVRELPGNHAYQTTATSRPVLSARYNLLTKTEQFDDAVWVKVGTGVSVYNATTAPDGTQTADLIVEGVGGTVHRATHALGTLQPQTISLSIRHKAGVGNRNLELVIVGGSNYVASVFSTTTGAVLANNDLPGSVFANRSAAVSGPDAYGFFTATLTVTLLASTTTSAIAGLANGTSNNYTGDGTSGIYIWGADLRVANDGVNIPPYQRVNTATDYDTAGFPLYLRCDGVDDGMVTNSIDFTGADKMTVVAGVRKLSDADIGVVGELSADLNTNTGIFALFAPASLSPLWAYRFVTKGTIARGAGGSTTPTAPTTNVLTGLGNISGDSSILRVNAVQAAITTADQGTGNYGNYPLYLFRRGGTTLPFNGRFYGMVVRGAQSTDAQIQSLESYMNVRTKAY